MSDIKSPFAECKFELCDLPGQCRGEGRCHHPKYTLAANQNRENGQWNYTQELNSQ